MYTLVSWPICNWKRPSACKYRNEQNHIQLFTIEVVFLYVNTVCTHKWTDAWGQLPSTSLLLNPITTKATAGVQKHYDWGSFSTEGDGDYKG